jgi:putative transposase
MSRQGGLRIERMCQLAQVSRAGFYRSWQEAQPVEEEMMVRAEIQQIALAHRRRYGYRRITAELRRRGLLVNHKRVARLMREDNLLAIQPRAFVVTTDTQHDLEVYLNLARRLTVTGINQLWVADITYIRLQQEFAYLAIVLDAFSRRVVGWALATHLQASLATAALTMAIAARRPAPGSLIHHSDRGVQYACGDYTALLQAHDIQPSMSRIGNPYDNAKAESFMKTLKQEEVDGRTYRDADHARQTIGRFIEEVYNCHRLHSALAYQSPAEFEANQHPQGSAMTTASRSLATALWGARSLAACSPVPNHQPGPAATLQTPTATRP